MDTIQTHVFTGGQWTTNTVPRSEYLARLNNTADPVPEGSPSVPEYGLLTRTLIPSPVVKKALPVKCRVGGVSDVVFVGESYIELASTEEDGKMQRGLAQYRFDAVILDAIAFRHRPRPPKTKKAPAGTMMARTAGLMDDMFGDVVTVKEEPGASQHRSRLEGLGKTLPPELLVLSLDTGDLAFCYVHNGPGGLRWAVSLKKIGAAGVRDAEDKPGKSLAVDPWSKYMHVSTFGSRWYLLRMASTDELEDQLLVGSRLDPVKEIRVDKHGLVVLHACFLYPNPDHLDHTLLLLTVIDPQKHYRVILHEWNNLSKQSLKDIDLRKEGIRLFDNVTMPLYVVPLSTNSSFLMVTEYEFLFGSAAEILSGNSNFKPLRHSSTRILLSPTCLVTSLAAISKAKSFKSRLDYIYYTVSDGALYLLELDCKDLVKPAVLQHSLITRRYDLLPSPSIAVLSDLLTGSDTLVIPGECSNGGILTIKPSGPVSGDHIPDFHPVLTNHAPIFDTALVSPPSEGSSHPLERDRLFATIGLGPAGAVAEIKTGYKAQVQTSADYIELVKDIWALPDASGAGFFLLSSTIGNSTMVYLDYEGGMENVDENVAHSLNLDTSTIAAGSSGNVTVQVTKNSVRLTCLGSVKEEDEGLVKTEPFVRECGAGEVIVRADVGRGYLVVVVSVRDEVRLIIAEVPREASFSEDPLKSVGEHVLLSDESSSIAIVKIAGVVHVVVGTWSSSLQVYRLEEGMGLMPVTEVPLELTKDGDVSMEPGSYICEDIRMLESSGHTRLFCGLRGGSLVSFGVEYENDMLTLTDRMEAKVAMVPVTFMKGPNKPSSVFLIAGPDIYQLHLNGSSYSLNHVIFEGPQQPKINAATRLSLPDSEDNIIVCVTDEELFYANVSSSLQTCVRQIPLQATPRRLLYYSTLAILIIACSPQSYPNPTPTTLKFLSPTTGEILLTGELLDAETKKPIFDKPNEQINALTEWKIRTPTGLEWRYIVAGTQYSSDNNKKGRMVFLSVTASPHGSTTPITIRKRYTWRLDSPVYAISPAGNRLVYSAGNSIYIGDLDVETKRFRQIDEYNKLRSPAIFITSSEASSLDRVPPFDLPSTTITDPKDTTTITVSTAADSLHILHFNPPKLLPQHNDDRARNGFAHLSFPTDPNFWLLSDKNFGLAGVWAPCRTEMRPASARLASQSLRTIFETTLPVSISRIRTGRARPAWSTPPSEFLEEGVKATIHEGHELIATGVDGTVLSLSVVEKDVFELLKRVSVEIEGPPVVSGKGHYEHHPKSTKNHGVLRGDVLAQVSIEKIVEAVSKIKRDRDGNNCLVRCFGPDESKWGEKVVGVVEGLLGGIVL